MYKSISLGKAVWTQRWIKQTERKSGNFVRWKSLFSKNSNIEREKFIHVSLKMKYRLPLHNPCPVLDHALENFSKLSVVIFWSDRYNIFNGKKSSIKIRSFKDPIYYCEANQWTGFYLIGISVIKELKRRLSLK